MPIRVVVADPYAGVRRSLELLLGSEPAIEVVGAADSLVETLHLIEGVRPDILLLATDLPGLDSGRDALPDALAAASPGTRVLLLSADGGEDLPAHVQRLGAAGALQFEDVAAQLQTAIPCIASGDCYSPGCYPHPAGAAT